MEDFSRRDFIKGVVGAGISLITADSLASVSMDMARIKNPYDAKGFSSSSGGLWIP